MDPILHHRSRLVIVLVESARASNVRRAIDRLDRKRLIRFKDILAAHVVVYGTGRLLHAAPEDLASSDQVVRDEPGLDVPCDQRFGLRVDAQFAGVAVIVGAIGSEEPGFRPASHVALGLVVAPIRIHHVVVDQRMAVAGRGKCPPGMRQIVVQPRVGVEGVKGVRLGPRLLA